MVGGIDVRIPSTGDCSVSIEAAVRAIRHCWPSATYENAVTADRYSRFSEIPFGRMDELFVYRDSRAAELWDAEGATPATTNTMVHLLVDDSQLTVVIDERNTETDRLIAAIESALSDDILLIPAQVAA